MEEEAKHLVRIFWAFNGKGFNEYKGARASTIANEKSFNELYFELQREYRSKSFYKNKWKELQ